MSFIALEGELADDRNLRVGSVRLWWPFPIASMLHSSCAVVLGRKVYGAGERRFIRAACRLFERISNARYWVLYRIGPRRYISHKVFLDLKPGCYDPDYMMMHAMMACLKLYIEQNGGPEKLAEFTDELWEPGSEGHGPRESVEGQAASQDSALSIWRWWTITKPADEKRRDELCERLYGNRPFTTKPTDNPKLVQWVPPEFSEDEVALEKEFRALEQKVCDDEQKMLARLVEIRRSLWT